MPRDFDPASHRDQNGDTPLHIASRFVSFVSPPVSCALGSATLTLSKRCAMQELKATPFGTTKVSSPLTRRLSQLLLDESAADIARTQAIFQIIQLISTKREAERELESLQHSRLRVERRNHQGGSRPGTRSRPASRECVSTLTHSAIPEGSHEDFSEVTPDASRHSYMVGYLPPEKEPLPFKGDIKKKKKVSSSLET
jgi:hypothetical protein